MRRCDVWFDLFSSNCHACLSCSFSMPCTGVWGVGGVLCHIALPD